MYLLGINVYKNSKYERPLSDCNAKHICISIQKCWYMSFVFLSMSWVYRSISFQMMKCNIHWVTKY